MTEGVAVVSVLGGFVLEVWVEVGEVVLSEVGVELVVGGPALAVGVSVISVFDRLYVAQHGPFSPSPQITDVP